MRRSDQPSRPSANTCCCFVSPKTLLMAAKEQVFLAGVNVSAATCGGRFSGVPHWPVLGVHRGSEGLWRRLVPVPFNVTIPEEKQDKRLTEN